MNGCYANDDDDDNDEASKHFDQNWLWFLASFQNKYWNRLWPNKFLANIIYIVYFAKVLLLFYFNFKIKPQFPWIILDICRCRIYLFCVLLDNLAQIHSQNFKNRTETCSSWVGSGTWDVQCASTFKCQPIQNETNVFIFCDAAINLTLYMCVFVCRSSVKVTFFLKLWSCLIWSSIHCFFPVELLLEMFICCFFSGCFMHQ